MNAVKGFGGALLFAIGGFFLLMAIDNMLHRSGFLPTTYSGFGFIGFLLIGLGLFLIVNGAREFENI